MFMLSLKFKESQPIYAYNLNAYKKSVINLGGYSLSHKRAIMS